MSRATNLPRALPAFVAGIMVCGAGAATAQQPQTRSGFWAALGLGYGADMLTCSGGCSFNSDSKGGSGTISLKLGGTPKSTLRLGGEVNLWVKDVAGVTEAVGNISGAVYLYPTPRSGFFLKAGVGVASFELSQGNTTTSADGVGFIAGLGYDIRLSRKVSLTPLTNFYFGHDGDLKDGSTVAIPGIQHAIIDVGLSVQYN